MCQWIVHRHRRRADGFRQRQAQAGICVVNQAERRSPPAEHPVLRSPGFRGSVLDSLACPFEKFRLFVKSGYNLLYG